MEYEWKKISNENYQVFVEIMIKKLKIEQIQRNILMIGLMFKFMELKKR